MDAQEWVRKGERGKAGYWLHAPSGWSVGHCGHPTAHFPWSLTSPQGEKVFSHNGYGFSCEDGKATVLALLAGTMRLQRLPRVTVAVNRVLITARNSQIGSRLNPENWSVEQFATLDFDRAEIRYGDALYVPDATGNMRCVLPFLFDPRPHRPLKESRFWEWRPTTGA